MAWDNKVVWSEGMFLRPQHFQQYDRYVEKLVRGRVAELVPHAWGASTMEINRELLAIGKFAVSSFRGVLADGTPVNIPEDDDHPPPLELPDNTRNCIVHLTLPARQPGGIEVDGRGTEETVARYSEEEFEARDTIAGSEASGLLRVGKLRLRYKLANEELAGHVLLGLARVVEVKADKNVILDNPYIPPCLDSKASTILDGFVSELQGLFHHRGEALAGRVTQTSAGGVPEIADFMLLQTVNRYEPILAHMATGNAIHPERLFALSVSMAGELATFMSTTRRPVQFPVYRHDDLQATFDPVMAELRKLLSAVLEQTAIAIPLQEHAQYGIYVGMVEDKTLFQTASFVLAVQAEMATELLRRHFPNQVKIGPVEQIRELVNVALPGVNLRPLPVAPRQIPFHAGVTYFEMDRSSEYWKQLPSSGGIAIHVGEGFPGLHMDCWAIRG